MRSIIRSDAAEDYLQYLCFFLASMPYFQLECESKGTNNQMNDWMKKPSGTFQGKYG